MTRAFRKVEAIGNMVNLAAYRYLRTRNQQEKEDAFDGLVGCCWVACRPLYAPTDDLKTPRTERTLTFIEKELRTILNGYAEVPTSEVDQLALNNQLRWVARRVLCKLIDAIRRYKAKQRRQERKKTSSQEPMTHASARRLAAWFKTNEARLAKLIGERNFETLMTLATSYPFGETKRARKSAMVRAIAQQRQVSLQQARSDRRHLLSAVENAGDYRLMDQVEGILGNGFLIR
jgi:hypothetical protein